MPRIVVTAMHEEEASYAKDRMRIEREGEGAVVGECDDAVLDELRDRHIVYEVLPDEGELTRRGFQVKTGLESFHGPLPPAPGDVVIACDGPIEPHWADDITAL